MDQNIAKIISSMELRPVPVRKLSDPTTWIPVLRVHDLTESELNQKPFLLKDTKQAAV